MTRNLEGARVARYVLTDYLTERRLLAAMIADEGVMECCGKVELDDFADPRHVAILTAIRNVQESGEVVSVTTVGDEVFAHDLRYSKNVYGSAGHWFLGVAMLEQSPYPTGALLFADIAWLRNLAKRRAAIA